LRKSSSELKIKSISPNNETIVSGVEPMTVNLELETSGGVNGDAMCSYVFGGVPSPFRITGGDVHRQSFQNIYSGNHEIDVRCEDIAGNKAEGVIRFGVEIDTKPPRVVRAYSSFNTMTVITDEASSCVYSTDKCNYNFENGTLMSGANRKHEIGFDRSETYYVKCKDRFDRGPGTECSVVVKGQRV